MSFFKSLFGGDVEGCMKRADACVSSGHWGEARLQLQKALRAVKDDTDPRGEAIQEKLQTVTRGLARSHEEEGDHLRDSGLTEESHERYRLALSLFEDEEDRQRIESKLSHKKTASGPSVSRFFLDESYPDQQASSMQTETPFEGDALEYFEVLTNTLDPEQAEEYRSLGEDFAWGYVSTSHGDYKAAVGYYEKAREAHPGQRIVHKELGRALLFQGEAERAAEELASARLELPEDLEVCHLLASAHSENGETDAALTILKEAQGVAPEEIETYLMMGDLYVAAGETAKAGEIYQQALKIDPGFPATHSRLGAWALAQGDKERAIDHFAEAVETGNDVQDMTALADLYLQEDRDPESALGLLNRALYYDPGSRWFYLIRIGEIYLKKGWEDKARETLSQAREMIPEGQQELLQKVNAYLQEE